MNQDEVTLKQLYPENTETELAKAEDNLEQYLTLVLRIFDRVEAETYPQSDQLISGTGTLGSCTSPPSESSK